MTTQTSVALIECGLFDKTYAENVAALPQGFKVNKAFVFHENARRALRKRFPELEWVEDYKDIFSDVTIRHVLISSPADSHRNLIGDALKANKHVQVV